MSKSLFKVYLNLNNYFQNKTAEGTIHQRLFLYLYFIDSLQQLLHINVCIDLLGQ